MISKDFFCRHPRKHQVFLKVYVYISLKYREILSRLITNPFQTLPTLMFGVIKHVLILYSCVSWGFQCSAVSRQMLPMSVSHPHTDYNHVSWSDWKGQHEVQLSVCLSVWLTDQVLNLTAGSSNHMNVGVWSTTLNIRLREMPENFFRESVVGCSSGAHTWSLC